jgi:tRNA(fMet)-specific endonuclease VapC
VPLRGNITVPHKPGICCKCFREFRKAGIRIGTLDLRIAAITLTSDGILLSRNLKDFEKVPGLTIQDWSI